MFLTFLYWAKSYYIENFPCNSKRRKLKTHFFHIFSCSNIINFSYFCYNKMSVMKICSCDWIWNTWTFQGAECPHTTLDRSCYCYSDWYNHCVTASTHHLVIQAEYWKSIHPNVPFLLFPCLPKHIVVVVQALCYTGDQIEYVLPFLKMMTSHLYRTVCPFLLFAFSPRCCRPFLTTLLPMKVLPHIAIIQNKYHNRGIPPPFLWVTWSKNYVFVRFCI